MSELKDIVKRNFVENDPTLHFKTTPLNKIFWLSIFSFGFYHIILTFDWWKTLKNNFGYKVSPFWRAWLSIFTNIKLFPIFTKYFKSFDNNIKFPGLLMGIIYFILAYVDHTSDKATLKLELKGILTPELDILLTIISFVAVLLLTLILMLIQNKINKINKQFFPNAITNTWNKSNTIWLLVLVLLNLAFLLSL